MKRELKGKIIIEKDGQFVINVEDLDSYGFIGEDANIPCIITFDEVEE